MATVILNPVLESMSGTIGRTVFYTRNGTTVMRAYIIPPNPNTPAQSKNRGRFRQAMILWQALDDDEKSAYNRKARRLGMTGHNLFIKQYMKSVIVKNGEIGGYGHNFIQKVALSNEFALSSTETGKFALSNEFDAGDNSTLSKPPSALYNLYRSVTAPSWPERRAFHCIMKDGFPLLRE